MHQVDTSLRNLVVGQGLTKRGHLLTIEPTLAVSRPTQIAQDSFTLPIYYVRHIGEQIRSMGGDVEKWLKDSGFSEAQLADPSFKLSYQGFEKLVRNSALVTNEPAIGLFVGQRLIANTHGMLGYAAMHSSTVREALLVFERYTRIRTTLLSIRIVSNTHQVQVHFEPTRQLGDIQAMVLEAVILSVKNVLGTISMGTCHVDGVSFPYDTPAYASVAREMFGCEVKYNRPTAALTLSTAALDLPLKMADAQAFEAAADICQRELDKLIADETTATRVRRLLLENQNNFPSLQLAARLLHMTPRTLHRRLIDEGTSYRDILESVRHTLAIEQIKSQRLTLEEIAYNLGYSDMANFRRAFKRWESVPPSVYAEKQRSERKE